MSACVFQLLYLLLCSTMLLEVSLNSKRVSNSSATSGNIIKVFDFDGCEGFDWGKYVWVFLTTLFFAIGFPASIAILWEMLKMYRRGTPFTPHDFFMLNLSTMDAVFFLFIPPGVFNQFMLKNVGFEAFWNGVYSLNTCGRPFLMACVCLDSYLAVVYPIAYRETKSLTPRVIAAAIVWIVTIANGIAYFFYYELFQSIYYPVPFIIAIVVIGVCDSFIVHTLIKSEPGGRSVHPQKKRAIQIMVNSLIVAGISYLPPVLLYLFGLPLISDPNIFICTIGIPLTVTSTMGSAVMPVLYLNNLGKLDCFRVGCCRKS